MTPEELEKLPKPLERTMSALELSIMSEIVQRIQEISQITPVTDWMLNRLVTIGESKTRIKEMIDNAIKKADLQVEDIYNQAIKSDYIRNKEIYAEVGKDYLPYEENQWLQQIVDTVRRQTKETIRPMENITKTTGFNVYMGGKKVFTPLSEYLERSLDKAMMGITTGVKTYSQAIRDIIDEMTSSGIRTVDYASGKSDRIEVAARRAVMTGIAQMTDKVNEKNAEELHTDHWEVDWHMGARNTGFGYLNHQSWQGKVYSTKEMQTVCGLGEMLGFAGINCYHIRFPFIPGVSKRKYTDEWLAEQNRKENKKKSFHGKGYDTYEALQYQRKLERTIRKQKQDIELMKKAGIDKDNITAAECRLQLANKIYTEFSKDMGLRQQRERLITAKSKVAFEGESAIIKAIQIPEEIHSIQGMTPDVINAVKEGIAEIESQYDIKLGRVLIENISGENPTAPFITRYVDNHGKHESVFVINKGYDFRGYHEVVQRGYEFGYFAGKSIKDHVIHEMAHIMTGQQFMTASGFREFIPRMEKQYIPGVSGYSDAARDGFETLAEAFIRIRNGEPIPEQARSMVEKYIERWKR